MDNKTIKEIGDYLLGRTRIPILKKEEDYIRR